MARDSLLRQAGETALANGRSKIEERLARWILMADDRVDGNELWLTQEFLSFMLGVQRSGVTVAMKVLTGTGLISHRRSKITILDRAALEKRSRWRSVAMERIRPFLAHRYTHDADELGEQDCCTPAATRRNLTRCKSAGRRCT